MDLGSIFLILALLVVVAVFVSRPFFEPQKAAPERNDPLDHERSSLLAERDRVLNLLRELEFDHTMGKTSEDDYTRRRNSLVEHGASILREMEALKSSMDDDDELGTQIEAAIAARKEGVRGTAPDTLPEESSADLHKPDAARGFTPVVSSPDDDLEVLIANRRRGRQEKSAGFCPKCGGPVQKSDHFCPKCGADIS
jgi:hypothetical protein